MEKSAHNLELIKAEHDKAKTKYPANFNSNHEAYAVLLEEVDELWDEIKLKSPSKENIKAEAIQIGAMCLRILNELTD